MDVWHCSVAQIFRNPEPANLVFSRASVQRIVLGTLHDGQATVVVPAIERLSPGRPVFFVEMVDGAEGEAVAEVLIDEGALYSAHAVSMENLRSLVYSR